MGSPKLIVSICIGKSLRKRVDEYNDDTKDENDLKQGIVQRVSVFRPKNLGHKVMHTKTSIKASENIYSPKLGSVSRGHTLTLCVLETSKRVLRQTGKTQMKCSILLHFIRVCTFA